MRVLLRLHSSHHKTKTSCNKINVRALSLLPIGESSILKQFLLTKQMAKRITRADGSLITVENMHTQRSADALGDKISASKKIVSDNVEISTKHRRKRRRFLLHVIKWRTDVSPTSVVSGYNTRLSVALNGGMRNGRSCFLWRPNRQLSAR